VAGARVVVAAASSIMLAVLAEASMGFLGLSAGRISLRAEIAAMGNRFPFPAATYSLSPRHSAPLLFAFNLLRARVLTLASVT
jgi:ABC-type dipeptide/oligopeptide/nickel transport system permease subunit